MSQLAKTSNGYLLYLIVFYIIYLFLGASIFDALESPNEARIIRSLNEYVKQFSQAHKCINETELNYFMREISQANEKGVPALRNVSKDQNWSFGQSVFFAGSVLTTIGYGNVSPLTKLGKVFCIAYALVGIPTTLLLLYAIIERLMAFTNCILSAFIDKSQHYLSTTQMLAGSHVQRSHLHAVFTILCALLVLVVFFIIPAAFYSDIEGWSYLNAFYYCFISLSTVGLGDYVPGDSDNQRHRHLYKICSTLYLLVGVMIMVWLLQIFSETPEFNVYQYFTLTKDGILTSHRDTVHQASPMTAAASASATEFNSSSINYQRQINSNNGGNTSVNNANGENGETRNDQVDYERSISG
jgi:potassium channel subfamily K member 1